MPAETRNLWLELQSLWGTAGWSCWGRRPAQQWREGAGRRAETGAILPEAHHGKAGQQGGEQVHPDHGVRAADHVAGVLVHRPLQTGGEPLQLPPVLVPRDLRLLRPRRDSWDGNGACGGTPAGHQWRGERESSLTVSWWSNFIQCEGGDSVGSINTASRNMIHKTMTLNSLDTDLFLPEMTESSKLFSDDQRKLLYRHLPPRVQGHTWSLIFSTGTHGFTLQSLYRACAGHDSPVLLVIQDTDHAVFGACISQPPALSEKFLGTGESWLFTFFPCFKVYSWTGENNYIMRAGPDTFILGSSQGRFGLWLDESFNQGRSQTVTTFDNKPLPGKEDFIVNNIECWTFVWTSLLSAAVSSFLLNLLSGQTVWRIWGRGAREVGWFWLPCFIWDCYLFIKLILPPWYHRDRIEDVFCIC